MPAGLLNSFYDTKGDNSFMLVFVLLLYVIYLREVRRRLRLGLHTLVFIFRLVA